MKASVNYVGRTSMEVGVRVEAEELRTGKRTHTNTSYFLMVALDDEGKPTPVSPLKAETHDVKRKMTDALERQERRLKKK